MDCFIYFNPPFAMDFRIHLKEKVFIDDLTYIFKKFFVCLRWMFKSIMRSKFLQYFVCNGCTNPLQKDDLTYIFKKTIAFFKIDNGELYPLLQSFVYDGCWNPLQEDILIQKCRITFEGKSKVRVTLRGADTSPQHKFFKKVNIFLEDGMSAV